MIDEVDEHPKIEQHQRDRNPRSTDVARNCAVGQSPPGESEPSRRTIATNAPRLVLGTRVTNEVAQQSRPELLGRQLEDQGIVIENTTPASP